ncbi:exported hypothetical protein [uncultured Desulfovibrio sp.]|uniref:Uncharacterized protein n=1 Tax=uncultured Desulfovibrio sp. TaxID=167968 RepID=A0A212L2N1_9BACT|nr:exported hypothetical protein [uncultured Desulfovibrio sp.]VZH33118.1 conserved protein of unknown function [Desulfovibrio sp. 86]
MTLVRAVFARRSAAVCPRPAHSCKASGEPCPSGHAVL